MYKPQNKLKLIPYSADYPKIFTEYQTKILKQLKGYKVEVHHVGSTAVQGLGGKGFIDILIGLPNWSKEKEIMKNLKKIGFTHIHPKENERIFLSKKTEDIKNHEVHLHIVKTGSNSYNEIIYFRDYLGNNPKKAKEYYNLKLKLLKNTKADREKYTHQKAKFIEQICKQIK